MGNPPVELVGDFDSAETRFLRSQFDDCRIELIARSTATRTISRPMRCRISPPATAACPLAGG